MKVTKNYHGACLTLAVEGKIDTITAPELKNEIDKIEPAVKDLVFDFANLSFISSAGLRVLVSTQKEMSNKGSMKIINANKVVKDVFDITGLNDVFTIE